MVPVFLKSVIFSQYRMLPIFFILGPEAIAIKIIIYIIFLTGNFKSEGVVTY